MSLFWLFGLCLYVWLFGVYENSYALFHKIGLFTLLMRYEREYSYFCLVSSVLGIYEISYSISHKIRVVRVVLRNSMGVCRQSGFVGGVGSVGVRVRGWRGLNFGVSGVSP